MELNMEMWFDEFQFWFDHKLKLTNACLHKTR